MVVHGLPFRFHEFLLAFSFGVVFCSPVACYSQTIDPERSLIIRDLRVVEDRSRTSNSCDGTSAPAGTLPVWSFGRLMKELAGDNDPAAFTLSFMQSWLRDQSINTDQVRRRTAIQQLIDAWPKTSGKLDLRRAPFRLLAIVYRPDLADRSKNKAGEARFVFGALRSDCEALQFTVIFEFGLPASSCQDTVTWAQRWRDLSRTSMGAGYNIRLQAITDSFSLRQTGEARPNESFLNQLRTNEIALEDPWQLREFVLDPFARRGKAFLKLTSVKQTPRAQLNGTIWLKNFINSNTAAILSETHIIPGSTLGAKSDVGDPWNASGIVDTEARHKFALGTCAGCHTSETGTAFVHIDVRQRRARSALSGFLTGVTVADPVSGVDHSFRELARRRDILSSLAAVQCGGGNGPSPAVTHENNSGSEFVFCSVFDRMYPIGMYPTTNYVSPAESTTDEASNVSEQQNGEGENSAATKKLADGAVQIVEREYLGPFKIEFDPANHGNEGCIRSLPGRAH